MKAENTNNATSQHYRSSQWSFAGWRRLAAYLVAYVIIVGGIDTIIAWDAMSVDRVPAITLMMSLLLLGGLTLGFVDRCVVRWFTNGR